MRRNAEKKFNLNDSVKNLDKKERIVSALGGGAIVAYGVKRGGFGGGALTALGSLLIYRGLSGHCVIYKALSINHAEAVSENVSVKSGAGIKVDESVIVNKSSEELYSFWRDFENLPKVMSHLESVETGGRARSHWVARAPLGQTVEWDAEIITDKPGEVIAWRSVNDSDVPNAGSVHFQETDGGTEIRVVLKYDPPGGKIGAALARLFGEEPARQIAEDLRRFKRLVENPAKSPQTKKVPHLKLKKTKFFGDQSYE